jgi:hypothetical protein
MEGLTLLREARAAGLSVARDGDELVIRGPRRAEPVARLLLSRKVEVIRALANATGWPARHREAFTHWRALHPESEAARLAWGELQDRWHMQYGERVPHWRCAGCREPIGRLAALDLADGNRVHLDHLDCLLSFGERWRSEAAAGLRALGLDPPVDAEPLRPAS